MVYTFEKISYDNGKWFVHLLIEGLYNLRLFLQNASGQKFKPNYLIVTSKHQIDDKGELFISTEPNHRSISEFGLHPLAVRYATQCDFDKYCFDNPDSRLSFDWNAEVHRAFESSTPGIYMSAANSDAP
tara:strand:- start:1113 stop:1499 length:387 start_codon:yes stop_codon:yes gene_type:complete